MFTRPFAASTEASTLFAREVPKLVLPPLVPSFPARGLASVVVPAADSGSLPGPAEGYIRIYDSVQVVPDALAAGLTSVVVSLVSNAVLYPLNAAVNITATATVANIPALAFGETLDVANASANTGLALGTYVDIPATGVTVVRAALDDVGVEIIPAAPTGYTARFLQRDAGGPNIVVVNLDAVTQSFEVLIGATLVSRSAPVLTTAIGVLAAPTLFATTSAVKVKLAAAVDTTAPVILAAYEVVPS